MNPRPCRMGICIAHSLSTTYYVYATTQYVFYAIRRGRITPVSEDYGVFSVLSRNSRRCVRPFQRRRPRSQRRTATSVEGLLRGMAVVATRRGAPRDGSDA